MAARLRLVRGALPFLMLAACSSHADDPHAVTADEARQLNEAAAMLDANSVDADALDADNEVTE